MRRSKITVLLFAVLLLAAHGCGGGAPDEAASSVSGETIYQRFCFSCHATGAANAPKVGDPAAWAPIIAQGHDVMLKRSIEGIPPGMPPRGLCVQCTDGDLSAAIDYMVAHSE